MARILNTHGFLPKISYWMGKWEEALESRDEESMKQRKEVDVLLW